MASDSPSMFADGKSVVIQREITNTQARSLSVTIETESHPGSSQSGTAVGIPPGSCTALNHSVICADKISGTTIENDLNLSVSMKTPQSGSVNETPSSSGVHYMEVDN